MTMIKKIEIENKKKDENFVTAARIHAFISLPFSARCSSPAIPDAFAHLFLLQFNFQPNSDDL
jgi:hypothetical protein